MNNEIKIAGIKEQFRIAKFPSNKNFEMVSFANVSKLNSFDGYIQWNIWGGKNQNIYLKYILESNKPFIVAESPLIRINYLKNDLMYFTYGWLSYKRNKAIFNNQNSPPDRWRKIKEEFDISIKDFHIEGDNILLILQRPADSSIHDIVSKCGSWSGYVEKIIQGIRKYSDRKIIVRPHPHRLKEQQTYLSRIDFKKYNAIISNTGSGDINISNTNKQKGITWSPSMSSGLLHDMKKSRVIVAYNSNTLTESVMYGKPAIALSETATSWPVCNRLEEIENLNLDINISQWLYDLAYCQWREDEVQNGGMWKHLKPKYMEAKNALLERA